MDQKWIKDGSTIDQGCIAMDYNGLRMDQKWINNGLKMDHNGSIMD